MATDLTLKPEDPLLTRKEAADYLGLACQTLAEWACTGKNLPLVKLGKNTVRYRKSALDAFIERSIVPASA